MSVERAIRDARKAMDEAALEAESALSSAAGLLRYVAGLDGVDSLVRSQAIHWIERFAPVPTQEGVDDAR